MLKDVSFTTLVAVIVGALVTVAIVGALIYLAVVLEDHDAKIALFAMVTGTSTGATSLVLLNRSSKTVSGEIASLEGPPAPAA